MSRTDFLHADGGLFLYAAIKTVLFLPHGTSTPSFFESVITTDQVASADLIVFNTSHQIFILSATINRALILLHSLLPVT